MKADQPESHNFESKVSTDRSKKPFDALTLTMDKIHQIQHLNRAFIGMKCIVNFLAKAMLDTNTILMLSATLPNDKNFDCGMIQ